MSDPAPREEGQAPAEGQPAEPAPQPPTDDSPPRAPAAEPPPVDEEDAADRMAWPGDETAAELADLPEDTPADEPEPALDERDPEERMAPPAEDAPADEPEQGDESAPPERPAAIVRYGLMNHIGVFRHSFDAPPTRGTRVVIRTERGVELGEVVSAVCRQACNGCITPTQLREFADANGPEYPLRQGGKVLRLANPQDVIDYRHLESSAREGAAFCRQQIAEMDLPMKVVTVEHLLGGERIIFYFAAETRVDFRDLVRRLAAQYRTRIEMRQVGARDEARLVADYERCGQPCCCKTFLKDLKPVSMRMAKTQKATLDPTKISGRCGRLMCCLRYEDNSYEELRARLPRKNIWVRTPEHVGKVIDAQIITQLVRIETPSGSMEVVANEDILERNVEPPPLQEAPPPRAGRSQPTAAASRSAGQALRDQLPPEPTAEAEAQEDARADETEGAEDAAGPPAGGPRKRRRRRRSRRKEPAGAGGAEAGERAGAGPPPPSDGPAEPRAGDRPQTPGGDSQQSSGGQKRRPRRRHRRKKGGGN